MKRLGMAGTIALGVLVLACSSVKEVEGPEITRRGTVEVLEVRNNQLLPLDATVDYNVYVYLPPGYSPDREEAYPVLLLLHGFGAWGGVWLDVFTVDQVMDYLINAGKIQPFVIVMPTGRNLLGGGWYTDGNMGPYETYIIRDVVDTIKARYHVSDTNWVIAGQSMGGYGAVRLFARHHQMFRGAAAMEGMLSLEAVLRTDLDRNGRPDILDRIFAENRGPLPTNRPLSQILGPERVVTTFMTAMAAQWSFKGIKDTSQIRADSSEFCLGYLAEGSPFCLVVQLPFRNDTTLRNLQELILPEVWNRWMQQDAKTMLVDSVRAGVMANKPILILAAAQDDYLLQFHARDLRKGLRDARYPDSLVYFVEYEGYGVYPPNLVPPGHTQYIFLDLKQVFIFADRVFRNQPFTFDLP